MWRNWEFGSSSKSRTSSTKNSGFKAESEGDDAVVMPPPPSSASPSSALFDNNNNNSSSDVASGGYILRHSSRSSYFDPSSEDDDANNNLDETEKRWKGDRRGRQIRSSIIIATETTTRNNSNNNAKRNANDDPNNDDWLLDLTRADLAETRRRVSFRTSIASTTSSTNQRRSSMIRRLAMLGYGDGDGDNDDDNDVDDGDNNRSIKSADIHDFSSGGDAAHHHQQIVRDNNHDDDMPNRRNIKSSYDCEDEDGSWSKGDDIASIISTTRDARRQHQQEQEEQPLIRQSTSFLWSGYKLIAEKKSLNRSLLALRMGVLADAINLTILAPNYPFLIAPDGHDQSFPTTAPLGFSAAVFFLVACADVGSAISSTTIGTISDRVGRRPCVLVCVGGSVLMTLLKYLLRFNFYTFCAANFINGLFAGTGPVALAYISDTHPNDPLKKDKVMSSFIALAMVGRSGGGLLAIFLQNVGLFTPLLVSAAFNLVAFIAVYYQLLEPNAALAFNVDDDGSSTVYSNNRHHRDDGDSLSSRQSKRSKSSSVSKVVGGNNNEYDDDDDSNIIRKGPTRMNWCLFVNVNIGAWLDNMGTNGLYPLSLVPLAFITFHESFVQAGETPLLSAAGYRWLVTCVSLSIIPGALLAPLVYKRISPAGGCVLGNLLTAVGIGLLLLIASLDPPTKATMAGFIMTFYGMFPFTVLSNLSTAPMLDRLSPESMRGFSQGINITIMKVSGSITPFLWGVMSDNVGIAATLWATIGVSVLAAIVNTPLIFSNVLGIMYEDPSSPSPLEWEETEESRFFVRLEDEEILERFIHGDWVPASIYAEINKTRAQHGLPLLIAKYKEYDRDELDQLRRHATSDFRHTRKAMYSLLNQLHNSRTPEKMLQKVARAIPSDDVRRANAHDFGKWFAEYMLDAGYLFYGGSPYVHKRLVMKAFPPLFSQTAMTNDDEPAGGNSNQEGKSTIINDGELKLTKEVMELYGLRYISVINDFLDTTASEWDTDPALRQRRGLWEQAIGTNT